jgi:hypothetical protein
MHGTATPQIGVVRRIVVDVVFIMGAVTAIITILACIAFGAVVCASSALKLRRR